MPHRRSKTPAGADNPGYDQAREAADLLAQRAPVKPSIALVLGSGLGVIADRVTDAVHVPYSEIPYFPVSTVVGHAGRLVLGALAGAPIAVMQGRFHFYEGYTPQQVIFPIRVLRLLGAETLIVTAAAGGLEPSMRPGDIMLLRDHIGLPLLAGAHPLRGMNDERFGPRFPATTGAYDERLRTITKEVAASQGLGLHEGVYVMLSGPSFESTAELRMARMLGGDAVGMSTAPEVIAACHMGMRSLGLAMITNAALPDSEAGIPASHAEVLSVANVAGGPLAALIEGVVGQLNRA